VAIKMAQDLGVGWMEMERECLVSSKTLMKFVSKRYATLSVPAAARVCTMLGMKLVLALEVHPIKPTRNKTKRRRK
jgi:hypothetical protein